MKKIMFLTLLVIIFAGSVYGQTQPENRWILGRWTGLNLLGEHASIVFNDNGTGTWNAGNFIYSILDNELFIFWGSQNFVDGNPSVYTIHRINNQRMILYFDNRYRTFGTDKFLMFNKEN